MNRTPQTANRDERLDILAGTRGDEGKRAVRLSEIPDLVAATAAGMIQKSIAAIPDAFPNGQLRARVNFNGTGTVAIREAANVASITDLGTGLYLITFTTPLANANYTIAPSASDGCFVVIGSLSVFSFAVATVNATGVAVDPATVCLTVCQ